MSCQQQDFTVSALETNSNSKCPCKQTEQLEMSFYTKIHSLYFLPSPRGTHCRWWCEAASMRALWSSRSWANSATRWFASPRSCFSLSRSQRAASTLTLQGKHTVMLSVNVESMKTVVLYVMLST